MRRLLLFVMALAAGLLVAVGVPGDSPAGSGQAGWVIRDLGTLGGKASYAYAINDRGQVVGESETASGVMHAFLWQSGEMTDLGALGGSWSYAYAINGRGQVVGESDTAPGAGYGHAFLWQKGKMTDLGTLGGDGWTRARAINDRGQVVGESETASGVMHAFLWQDGKMTDVGSPRGWSDDTESSATAINGKGQIVGWGDGGGLEIRAFLWQQGQVVDLRGLPGPSGLVDCPTDCAYYTAGAINERGQVIGTDWDQGRGFLWENGRVRDLGTLGGHRYVDRVSAINERGQVVGWSFTATARQHAFLWQEGRMIDLGTPRTKRSFAVAINERGQVVGWIGDSAATSRCAETRAFVWQDGAMTELGTLGGSRSLVLGGQRRPRVDTDLQGVGTGGRVINDDGQIVGWATTKTGERHAVLWTLRSS
jgi:probable HAF family extracellular repeat protein